MNDEFSAKRGMVKQLLEMLKKHASDEVNGGLKHPKGEGDMHGIQAENVENIDHEMDHPTPEHDVVTHDLHAGGMAYSKGGVVEDVSDGDYPSAPSRKIPYESADGQPDKEGAVHKEVMEPMAKRDSLTTTEHEEPLSTEYPDAEPEQSSMFQSFLSRKRKK